MRVLIVTIMLLAPSLAACTEEGLGEDGAADLAGQDDTTDGALAFTKWVK